MSGTTPERPPREIGHLLQLVLSPRGESLAPVLFNAMSDNVAGVVVDGALLKTAQHAQAGRYKRVVIIVRIPARVESA
eukprot:11225344-Lingulodinium_polyedra.AAC.1